MPNLIKTISVTGHEAACLELNAQQREKLAAQMISDKGHGKILRTPVGAIDRSLNQTITIETDWNQGIIEE